MNKLGTHFMINNGLREMAANAVELAVDERTGIAYAVYLSSEAAFGESSELVNLAKFNIMQPTNVAWVSVFDRNTDFFGSRLSECNIIDLDRHTVRVFAVNPTLKKASMYLMTPLRSHSSFHTPLGLAYSTPSLIMIKMSFSISVSSD